MRVFRRRILYILHNWALAFLTVLLHFPERKNRKLFFACKVLPGYMCVYSKAVRGMLRGVRTKIGVLNFWYPPLGCISPSKATDILCNYY